MTDWHAREIPLQVVFEAIDAAFEKGGRRRSKSPPRSLAFVAPAVEECWQVILEGRSVGEHPGPADDARDAIAAWRARLSIEGGDSALGRLLSSLLDHLAQGAGLEELEQRLEEELPQVVSRERLVSAGERVDGTLHPFRQRLDAVTMARTREHAIVADLRRTMGLPRLRRLGRAGSGAGTGGDAGVE